MERPVLDTILSHGQKPLSRLREGLGPLASFGVAWQRMMRSMMRSMMRKTAKGCGTTAPSADF
jgi:hypothetical protein